MRAALCLALLVSACDGAKGPAPDVAPTASVQDPSDNRSLWFVDGSQAAGLASFRNQSGSPDKDYITDSFGAGVALFDYDRDGDLDLYVIGGGSIASGTDQGATQDALFAGDGTGKFRDVTQAAGIGPCGWTYGVCAADLDGDGWCDLYVTTQQSNTYWRNLGDGTFEDATKAAGIGGREWSAGALAFDYDRDGDLDLWVTNHIDFDRASIEAEGKRGSYLGQAVYFGPGGLPGVADRLYANQGDGTFRDRSIESGVTKHALCGFQAVAVDVDQDGWLDVYVANDSQPNQLWHNQGDGTFIDKGLEYRAALSVEGGPQAGMGVAVGDADGDGADDLFVTNFSEDYFTLYQGSVGGVFRDVTRRSHLMQPTLASLGWASMFVDFDADGDVDLFAANGHVFPQMDAVPAGPGYQQRNQVFENLGDGRFAIPAGEGGPGLLERGSHRGGAAGDVDGDGDMDLVIGRIDASPILLLNQGEGLGSSLWIDLVGAGANPGAVGARIEVQVGDRSLSRTVGSQQGFLSSSAPAVHFGLGTASQVDRIKLTWPDGSQETFGPAAAGERLRLVQGAGRTE